MTANHLLDHLQQAARERDQADREAARADAQVKALLVRGVNQGVPVVHLARAAGLSRAHRSTHTLLGPRLDRKRFRSDIGAEDR